MPITVTCPQCQKNYKLRDDYAGGKLRCKTCNTVFALPQDDPFADGALPDLAPDPTPAAPALYTPPPPTYIPPRVVTVGPARPTAPARPLYLWQRIKTFAYAGVLLIPAAILLVITYWTYSEASLLAQKGTPSVANVTAYRQVETRGRYGSRNYTDKYTLAYGDNLQYSKEVTLAFKVIFPGTSKTGNVFSYDGTDIPEPQVHVLYLAEKPKVVLAGEKGDSVGTLLGKNDQWVTIIICGLIGGVMLVCGLGMVVKAVFYSPEE